MNIWDWVTKFSGFTFLRKSKLEKRMLISCVKVLDLPIRSIKCHSCISICSYNSWLWVEICPAVKRKRPPSLEFNSIWTRHGLMTPVQRISLRLTTMTNRRKTGSLGYVHFNGSFTLPQTDSGTDSDLDSKPDGYIVLYRTCSHCTESDLVAYSLFLHRAGIRVRVCTWFCLQHVNE